MFEDDSDEDGMSSLDPLEDRQDDRREDEDTDKVGPLQILDAAIKVRYTRGQVHLE